MRRLYPTARGRAVIPPRVVRPPRPSLRTAVRVSTPVTLELTRREAFTALAAVHDARLALRAQNDPSRAALLDALETHERELGMAIGPAPARAFLKRRARRLQAPAAEARDPDPSASGAQ